MVWSTHTVVSMTDGLHLCSLPAVVGCQPDTLAHFHVLRVYGGAACGCATRRAADGHKMLPRGSQLACRVGAQAELTARGRFVL